MIKKTVSDLKMKIFNKSLSRGKIYSGKNIYWKKKKRPTLSYKLKKIKRLPIGWLKEKNTVRAAKLQYKMCSILSKAK